MSTDYTQHDIYTRRVKIKIKIKKTQTNKLFIDNGKSAISNRLGMFGFKTDAA